MTEPRRRYQPCPVESIARASRFDAGGCGSDRSITIDEILAAVNKALSGCG